MRALLLGEAGGDPIEDRLRETVRATVEALFDEEPVVGRDEPQAH